MKLFPGIERCAWGMGLGALFVVAGASMPVRAEPAASVKLRELWRVAGNPAGIIRDIDSDAQGNVYLLDSQRCTVGVYSSTGQLVRSIGHEGEGPGEFRRPVAMFLMDGNVAVVQMMPAKIVMLSPDGKPVGDITLAETPGAVAGLQGGDACGGNTTLLFDSRKFDEAHKKWTRNSFLASVTPQGKPAAQYCAKETIINLAAPVLDDAEWDTFEHRWQVGPDGKVYAAKSYENCEITVYDTTGKVERVITRDSKPVARIAAEKDAAAKAMAVYSKMIPNCKTRIHETARAIESFCVRDDGSVWVLSAAGARNLPAGALGSFDIFNPKGQFVRTITLVGQGHPLDDRYVFDKDRLYVIAGSVTAALREQGVEGMGDAAPMSVICYKLDGDSLAAR